MAPAKGIIIALKSVVTILVKLHRKLRSTAVTEAKLSVLISRNDRWCSWFSTQYSGLIEKLKDEVLTNTWRKSLICCLHIKAKTKIHSPYTFTQLSSWLNTDLVLIK